MSILEKLGLYGTPWGIANGSYLYSGDCDNYLQIATFENDDDWEDQQYLNKKLILVAPEMLEALIEFCLRVDRYEVRSIKTYAKFKSIIEKVTDKTWEEIKELL